MNGPIGRVRVHPTARCGACGCRTDLEARCFVCWQGWMTDRRVDRLLADGVEINADLHDAAPDVIASQMLARIVRRFGVRRLLLALSEGAETMLDLGKDEDTGVTMSEDERAALHELARGLATASGMPGTGA